MKIRKYGWAVWDKDEQRFIESNGMIVYSSRQKAWLAACKERKTYGRKVVKINISIFK